MKVELYYFDRRPSWEQALDNLKDAPCDSSRCPTRSVWFRLSTVPMPRPSGSSDRRPSG